jgi:dTMP kinase
MPLIVLEGLDGAGKSTQVKLLSEYFVSKSLKTYYLHFPRLNVSIFGELIAEFLRGEFGDINQVHPKLVALLYAGDRWHASAELNNYLKNNYIVILDRYVFSNVAYQCAKINDNQEKIKFVNWLLDLEFNFYKIPKPDVNIFLDVPINFIREKLSEPRESSERDYLKGKKDIHEQNIEFQTRVRDEYLFLCKNYNMHLIDCSENGKIATQEVVFNRLLNLLKKEKIFEF